MGLDMYLKASKYVGGWDHSDAASKQEYESVIKTVGMDRLRCDDSPSIDVSVTVAYWRKANAIHAWFVEHVQDGVDECEPHDVTREQLESLRDLCRKVLAEIKIRPGDICTGTTFESNKPPLKSWCEGTVVENSDAAAQVLPTKGGFFFGSTDYDEGYIDDLKYTADRIDLILRETSDDVEFSYRSSW